MSAIHTTEMVFSVPDDWFDGSVSVFEHDDFLDNGVVVIIRRAPLRETVEAYVERDVAETRRSLPKCAVLARGRQRIAGYDVAVVQLGWASDEGDQFQVAAYGSIRPGRVFRLTAAGPMANRAQVEATFRQVVASAQPVKGS